MARQIDCYGFEATSEFFRRRKLETYLMKDSDGVLFMCFDDRPRRPIHRIDRDADGNMRIMWAYGAWAGADALDYIPINETMTLKED